MKHYDIVIKNGQIYDGTGNAPYRADVAILEGKIAAIEPSMTASAERTIDAEGKVVTPGFVDVHTHYDGQATWDNHLAPLLTSAQPLLLWAIAALASPLAGKRITMS